MKKQCVWVCAGGEGCERIGCKFVAIGTPEDKTEQPYMCPYNHRRSCKWIKKARAGK